MGILHPSAFRDTRTSGGGGGGGSTTIIHTTTTITNNNYINTETRVENTVTIDGSIPYEIAGTETFTVADRRQALYKVPIKLDGTIVLDGILAEVD